MNRKFRAKATPFAGGVNLSSVDQLNQCDPVTAYASENQFQ
jgi:hypothetical protein